MISMVGSGRSLPVRNPYIAGNPVTGAEVFVGREDVFDVVERTLQGRHDDNVVILHGQRRIGKTTVLYQLRRRWSGSSRCVLIDLQPFALDGLNGFLWEIATQIVRDLQRQHVVDLRLPDHSTYLTNAREVFQSQFLPETLRMAGVDKL